jgi:tetratricopeptide (TPR) repeat protein
MLECDLASILDDEKKPDESVKFSLLCLDKVQGLNADRGEYLPKAFLTVGQAYTGKEDYPKAEDYLRRGLSAAKDREGPNGLNVATAFDSIATLYLKGGKPQDAEVMQLEADRIYKGIYGKGSLGYAGNHRGLLYVYLAERKFDEGELVVRDVIEIRVSQLGKNYASYSDDLFELGRFLDSEKKYGDALAAFKDSLNTERDSNPYYEGTIYIYLARVSESLSQLHDAEAFLQEGLSRFQANEKNPGWVPTSTTPGELYCRLGNLQGRLGKTPEAEKSFLRGMELLPREASEWCSDLFADYYFNLKRFDESEKRYLNTIILEREQSTPDQAEIARLLNNIGKVQYLRHDYSNAKTNCSMAVKTARDALPSNSPELAWYIGNLALVEAAERNYQQSVALYQEAVKIDEKAVPPGDARRLSLEDGLRKALKAQSDSATTQTGSR